MTVVQINFLDVENPMGVSEPGVCGQSNGVGKEEVSSGITCMFVGWNGVDREMQIRPIVVPGVDRISIERTGTCDLLKWGKQISEIGD